MQSKFTAAILAVLVAAAGWYLLLSGGESIDPEHSTASSGETKGENEDAQPVLIGNAVIDHDGGDSAADVFDPALETPRLVTCTYVGTVANKRHKPVAKCEIRVTMRGKPPITTTTDASGTYKFTVQIMKGGDHFDEGTVFARGPEGATGYANVKSPPVWKQFVEGQEQRLGVSKIYLRAGFRLEVNVSSDCPEAIPARVWIGQDRIGHWTNEAGHVVIEGLYENVYVIASARGCGRASKSVHLVRDGSTSVSLVIPRSRTLRVIVREEGSHKPVDEARVQVMPPLISIPSVYTTDAEGQVRIAGLGNAETLRVLVEAEGYPDSVSQFRRFHRNARKTAADQNEVAPGLTEFIVELRAPRVVRWKIVDGGHGIPPDGSDVLVRALPNQEGKQIPSSGTIKDGALVISGWAGVTSEARVYIRGFGATLITAAAEGDDGGEVTFAPFRSVIVTVTEPDGTPTNGAWLLVTGGDSLFGRESAKTNGEGVAVVEGLYGGPGAKARAAVARSLLGAKRWGLGALDMSQGDANLEFEFPAKSRINLAVLVDGDRPPDDFFAQVQVSTRRGPYSTRGNSARAVIKGGDGVYPVVAEVDRREPSMQIYISSQGYRQDRAISVPITTSLTYDATIELSRLYEAAIQIIAPADDNFRLNVQRYNEEQGNWVGTARRLMSDFSAGVVSWGGLRVGLYRSFDALSGTLGSTFRVGPKHAHPTSTLDLSKVCVISGRVIAPELAALGRTRIRVDGGKAGQRDVGAQANFDIEHVFLHGARVSTVTGAFSIRLPDDSPITLRVVDSTLRTHPSRGQVTVRGPRKDVLLYLIEGPRVTVRFNMPLRPSLGPVDQGSSDNAEPEPMFFSKNPNTLAREVSVRATPKKGGTPFLVAGKLNDTGDEVSIDGLSAGTYSLWIDTLSFAPVVIPNVKVGDSNVDLGRKVLSAGSTIRLRPSKEVSRDLVRMVGKAYHRGAPSYVRAVMLKHGEVVVRGLGAGVVSVVGRFSLVGDAFAQEIAVDGKTDVEQVIDLK